MGFGGNGRFCRESLFKNTVTPAKALSHLVAFLLQLLKEDIMDYVLSPLADDDLDEIWLHIAYDNQPAADKMIRKIFETITF